MSFDNVHSIRNNKYIKKDKFFKIYVCLPFLCLSSIFALICSDSLSLRGEFLEFYQKTIFVFQCSLNFLYWTSFLERSFRRLNFSLDHVSAPKLIYLSPKLKTLKLNKVGTKTCCVFPNWKYRMKNVFSNVFDWVRA